VSFLQILKTNESAIQSLQRTAGKHIITQVSRCMYSSDKYSTSLAVKLIFNLNLRFFIHKTQSC